MLSLLIPSALREIEMITLFKACGCTWVWVVYDLTKHLWIWLVEPVFPLG